jgi:hypothetical protein
MISNERTWPQQRKFYRQPGYNSGQPNYNSSQPNYNSSQPSYHSSFHSPQRSPERPFVQEDKLKTAELQVERKQFFLTLKENPRGRFLRISEETSGRRNSIIIPATGLAEFCKLLEEMRIAAEQTPPQSQPTPE